MPIRRALGSLSTLPDPMRRAVLTWRPSLVVRGSECFAHELLLPDNLDLVSCLNGTFNQRSSDDGTETVENKDAVNRQPEREMVSVCADPVDLIEQCLSQFFDAFTCRRGSPDHRRVLKESTRDMVADVLFDEVDKVLFH